MKSTHHKIRALAKSLGLALLMVTGTAVMLSAFSGQTPLATPNSVHRSSVAAPAAKTTQQTSSDSLLYQQTTQSDGSHRWELLEETVALAFIPASRDLLMAEGPAFFTLTQVSYTLQAKPVGWKKVLESCTQTEAGKPLGAAAAYDIGCAKLG